MDVFWFLAGLGIAMTGFGVLIVCAAVADSINKKTMIIPAPDTDNER